MNISYKWLSDYLDLEISMSELADKFNAMSQEIADVYKLTDVNNVVIGEVLEKEKHPDADKLNVCKVNVGEVTQIVCGAPNVEVGQKVIVALPGAELPEFKIKKSKIRGVESNGMICSLVELGIDKKYCDASGIEVLPVDAVVGGNPVEFLFLDDEVMELDLTPNRADLLSVMGAAYDTAALTSSELTLPYPNVMEIEEENPVKVTIDTDNCMSYYTRVIKNITITDSPKWMQARLIASGVRPINNVVDITNYIMLETGQPLHAFDLDKVKTNEIVVRMATKDETLLTLDDQERALKETDIMITNGEESVALGGVMGGANTEIDGNTTYVLLESATFNPVSVRKTSRRLDLRSDASMRFEKGVDPNRALLALERATELFASYANGEVLSGINFVDNNDLEEKQVSIDLEFINSYVGKEYTLDDIMDVFDRLNFEYEVQGNEFNVSVPTRRQDITIKNDLIEEIVRINGYDNVPLTLPKTVSLGKLTEAQKRRRKIRRILTGMGLDEVVTYSLVNEKLVHELTNNTEDYTKLLMPMSEDKAVMRHSALTGMIQAVKYNLARKTSDVTVFEMSNKYTEGEDALLSMVLTGSEMNNAWNSKQVPIDFYYIKGIVDTLVNELGLSVEYKKTELNKNYHPGQSAGVYVDGLLVGFIAKLHPKFEASNDLNDTFVFEMNISKVSFGDEIIKYKPLQKYPTMERDIAIEAERSLAVGEMVDVIKAAGKKLLKKVEVFDVYTGEHIDESKKSVAIKLFFNDAERTLETEEVNNRVEKIVKKLESELNVKLRD